MDEWTAEEIGRLKLEVAKEEGRTRECQREIERLRCIVRTYQDMNFLDVELDISVSGRHISDVMEIAWQRALELDAKRLSFSFNSHKITIEKEE